MSKESFQVPIQVAEILIRKGYEEGTAAQHIFDEVVLCTFQLAASLTRITDNVLITADTSNQSSVLKLFFRGNEASKALWLQIGNLRTAIKEYDEYSSGETSLSFQKDLEILLQHAFAYHDAINALVADTNPDNGQLLREAVKTYAKNSSEKMEALKKIRPKSGRTSAKNDWLTLEAARLKQQGRSYQSIVNHLKSRLQIEINSDALTSEDRADRIKALKDLYDSDNPAEMLRGRLKTRM